MAAPPDNPRNRLRVDDYLTGAGRGARQCPFVQACEGFRVAAEGRRGWCCHPEADPRGLNLFGVIALVEQLPMPQAIARACELTGMEFEPELIGEQSGRRRRSR